MRVIVLTQEGVPVQVFKLADRSFQTEKWKEEKIAKELVSKRYKSLTEAYKTLNPSVPVTDDCLPTISFWIMDSESLPAQDTSDNSTD